MAVIRNPGRSSSRACGTGITRRMTVGQSMSTRTREVFFFHAASFLLVQEFTAVIDVKRVGAAILTDGAFNGFSSCIC
ncbi:MAG: hypothetical protein LBK41_02885 [Clostridiales bacterium]|jgi:hypothetical protein|nr:hypothetical protein [Clostridiales bacterium]